MSKSEDNVFMKYAVVTIDEVSIVLHSQLSNHFKGFLHLHRKQLRALLPSRVPTESNQTRVAQSFYWQLSSS